VPPREEQGHVDGHAGEDRLLDGGNTFLRARNLDEEVRASRARVELLGLGEGARGVVGERRRDLERHIAVDPVRLLVDRPEEIGGLGEVLHGQLEEQRLARLPLLHLVADGRVVVVALGDGVVEDRGIRGQSGDR
jgi:hypothetical protein